MSIIFKFVTYKLRTNMYDSLQAKLTQELSEIEEAGLFKNERVITTPQGANIQTNKGDDVINFCANNYLGLSSHPKVIQAAKDAIDSHGYGMSSVRFICGTQDIHKEIGWTYSARKHAYSLPPTTTA